MVSSFVNFRNTSDKIAIIGYYLAMNFSIDAISKLALYFGSNNLVLLSFLSFFEILLIGLLYKEKIFKSVWLMVLIVCGLLYIVVEGIIIDQNVIESFHTYSRIVSSFIIVLMVLNYLFTELQQGSVLKNDVLQFAILTYYSLEFMLLIPFNFLINASEEFIINIFFVRFVVNLIFYSYLIYFIWRNGKILR